MIYSDQIDRESQPIPEIYVALPRRRQKLAFIDKVCPPNKFTTPYLGSSKISIETVLEYREPTFQEKNIGFKFRLGRR